MTFDRPRSVCDREEVLVVVVDTMIIGYWLLRRREHLADTKRPSRFFFFFHKKSAHVITDHALFRTRRPNQRRLETNTFNDKTVDLVSGRVKRPANPVCLQPTTRFSKRKSCHSLCSYGTARLRTRGVAFRERDRFSSTSTDFDISVCYNIILSRFDMAKRL